MRRLLFVYHFLDTSCERMGMVKKEKRDRRKYLWNTIC